MDRQERILKVIKQVAAKDVQARPEEHLFESGILDSFGLPDLVAGLEDEFRISIPDGDLQPGSFSSIQRIDGYLDRRGA